MSFTQVFGGTTLYPSDVSYLAITLDADKALAWPLESNDPENPAASIIDVTTTGAHSLTLPDATQTGAGQTLFFNNLGASTDSFTLRDAAGGVVATIGIGEQWQVYLADTATAAGTWRVFRFGASTATVQPSALAGYGITVTANTLSQSLPVTTFNTSPRTALVTDRASALVWSGTGTGTLNLPSAVTVGNNYFIAVRNSGGGDLTIDPAGSETIDGTSTLALRPGDSANLLTDGLRWYTLGLGQEAVFAFDYTSITVTGGTYTLAGSELNRIAYKFVGTLTSDQYVVVPSTVQQYWVDNATSGPYAFYLQTSGGTPISVTQGARGIYYCNGTNMVDADTATVALPVSAPNGGTGITSYTTGDLLYANSSTTLAKLSDVAVGNVLLSGGVGVAPQWGKVDLATAVLGALPVTNGGTGATSLTSGYLVKGNGTSAAAASVVYDDGTNVGIGTNSPAVPLEVAGDVRALGLYQRVNNSGLALSGGTTFNTGGAGIGLRGASASFNSYGMELYTGGSERMRIDSSGNVGIGTTSPGSKLTVAGVIESTTGGIKFPDGSTQTTASSGSLTNWAEAVSTSSPNATVPAVSFTANNAASNVDATLAPKGTGAVLAAVPTGTSAGGNKRGAFAVDLQRDRASAARVASGQNSVIVGGASNTASGNWSAVLGGENNTASANYAAALAGLNNSASGDYAATLGGAENAAGGIYSSAAGYYATARGLYGASAYASGRFAALGDAQTGRYVLRTSTTTATTTEMTSDGSAGSSTNRVVLPNDSTYVFDILVVARRTDVDNESAGYRFTGVIDRNATAGSTAIVGTVTKTVLAEDSAAWDVTVDADTTNGSLRVQVNGEAAKTIRWVAIVNTVEVVG